MKLPVTLLIPVLLVISTLISSYFVYIEAKQNARYVIKEDTLRTTKLDITRLQNILYNYLTESSRNIEDARLNLSVTAMDPSIRVLVVTDETENVIMANRYLWEGRQATEVTNYKSDIANQVKSQNTPETFYDKNDEILTGYYPVVLRLESEKGLPVKRLGVLFTEVSIANKLAHAESNAFKDSLRFISLMFAATLIVAILIHLLISRRLKKLTLAADKLSSGNLDAKVGLRGKDELSKLGNAFDAMIVRIKDEFTQREMAESKLRLLNENLEQRINERTVELEEKKLELMESQARAYHANKMASLGEMASGIAHEINSPLQAISLLTYKIRRDLEKSQHTDSTAVVDKIDGAVKKVSEIIDSLRNVSRDSSSDPVVKVPIKEIIDDVLGITSERYKLKGIKLKSTYGPDLENAIICCQRLQISQVLINLLNNSYDAVLGQNDRWITMDISEAGDFYIFSVCNSGVSIPEEHHDRIFEPMFTTKDVGKGTGLGLSISLEIAKRHNGTLKLDTENEHTCFKLTLPKCDI